MNTNNQLRFARVGGGGGETPLWLGTGNVVTNCDQALTVDCVGARLTLHLNGGRLATVLDLGGPTTGGIGLYGGNTQGVRFMMTRVGLPTWEPYYRFAGEGQWPTEPVFVCDPDRLPNQRFWTRLNGTGL